MKHVFVFDPKAFHNQQWKMDGILDGIGQFFRTQDKPNFSIQFSRYRRNAIGIIQDEAEKADPEDIIRVYAIGGEEILFDCLNGVTHFPNTQLAVVPYGETNNFLKIFGDNEAEMFKDIPTLIKSETISTDVIKWGANYALSFCYIGMNSAISKNIKDLKSRLRKGSFFIISKLSTLLNNILTLFDKQLSSREYNIFIDEIDYSGKYCLIHVANSPHFSGKKTGVSEASPNDGMLDIVLIKASFPLAALSSVKRYSKGKRPKNCIFIQGKKVTVHSDSQMWIQLDNEYIQDTSINLSVVHHALQMVSPSGLIYPSGSI